MDRQVKDWINFWALEMRSPKNDGFTSQMYRDKLVEIKEYIEMQLKTAPTFVGDD